MGVLSYEICTDNVDTAKRPTDVVYYTLTEGPRQAQLRSVFDTNYTKPFG